VHFVYIVRCADGTLYTGYARDPLAREKVHNSGRGARYTAGRLPVTLVYAEACESRGEALSREHELKGLRRALKEALIARKPLTDLPQKSSPGDSQPRVR
jgi:predicted GIY-YIG superfamily endonuclease